MGKTAFSGPVYGAKQTLASVRFDLSSGVTAVVYGTIVPVGEDWYVTEFGAHRSSTGSTGFGVSLLDDSTVVSSVTVGSSSANAQSQVIIAADPGEYEGARIASGSTVTFSATDGAGVASTGVSVTLFGYRRFVSSTRSE